MQAASPGSDGEYERTECGDGCGWKASIAHDGRTPRPVALRPSRAARQGAAAPQGDRNDAGCPWHDPSQIDGLPGSAVAARGRGIARPMMMCVVAWHLPPSQSCPPTGQATERVDPACDFSSFYGAKSGNVSGRSTSRAAARMSRAPCQSRSTPLRFRCRSRSTPRCHRRTAPQRRSRGPWRGARRALRP